MADVLRNPSEKIPYRKIFSRFWRTWRHWYLYGLYHRCHREWSSYSHASTKKTDQWSVLSWLCHENTDWSFPGDTLWYKTGKDTSAFRCVKIGKISSDPYFFRMDFSKRRPSRHSEQDGMYKVVEYDMSKWSVMHLPRRHLIPLQSLVHSNGDSGYVNTEGAIAWATGGLPGYTLIPGRPNSVSRRSASGILYFQDTATLKYIWSGRLIIYVYHKKDGKEHWGVISMIDQDTFFQKTSDTLQGNWRKFPGPDCGPSFPVNQSRIIYLPPEMEWSFFTRNQYIRDTKLAAWKGSVQKYIPTPVIWIFWRSMYKITLAGPCIGLWTKISRKISFETEISYQIQVINDRSRPDPYLYPLYRYTGSQ